MDFFAQQDHSRKQTGLMLVCFSLSVLLSILLVYFLPMAGLRLIRSFNTISPFVWWKPQLFYCVCGTTLAVVLGGAWYKISELKRGGGAGVARMLGGRLIPSNSTDFFESRLCHVVEEMAIASGMPVPQVFVMPREEGVNAFAAGFTPYDSVVSVTQGAMTGLTRDELQAVVAHEFSHILNSDMQINIQMLGVLHGLLLIGLTGEFLLERDHCYLRGKGAVAILGTGMLLVTVGYAGLFCGKLIKNMIACQREFLADASAVQFTRNPQGLASALKKIGGLGRGSRLRSSYAEQVAHMCFGRSGRRSRRLPTHPPLKERIRKLDPSFDGHFDRLKLEDLQQNLVKGEGAPVVKRAPSPMSDIYQQAAAAFSPGMATAAAKKMRSCIKNPTQLIMSIGRPAQKNVEIAQALIESIPTRFKNCAREPDRVCALIYLLLLDADASIKTAQLASLKERVAQPVYNELELLLPRRSGLTGEMRLPLIDLCVATLHTMPRSVFKELRFNVRVLIMADGKVDVFEYALQHVLIRQLDQHFSEKHTPPITQFYAICGLQKEASCILSVLARKGHADEESAKKAFLDATSKINDPRAAFEFQSAELCTWAQMDIALARLNLGSMRVKQWLLGGALACLAHDEQMTIEEVELFRAISSALRCPVPSWLTPSSI